eukprot:3317116-Heterocapsa_arctica.AAC.1
MPNESGRQLPNQCLYLSLARSLAGDDATNPALYTESVHAHALVLKREIEGSVRSRDPVWASKNVGERSEACFEFVT